MAEPTPTPHTHDHEAYRDAVGWLVARRRDGRPRDPRVAAELLRRWGRPLPPAVVHVVGTNGKGTVSHAVAAMASAHGLRCGRFTSPHVEDLRERVAIDGVPPSRDDVVRFVARARTLVAPGVGFFEWTLAWAIDAFADAKVDLAVVEAGVGARHDATIALPHVIGAVLTNVDLDHLETLGPTLADIASDKAAVARPGVPLVTAARGEALAIVTARAAAVGAPLAVLDDEAPLFRWPAGAAERAAGWPPTRIEDARLALALGRLLGWSEEALAAGLAAPPPPARYERFVVPGPTGPVDVVLDGAHDPAAARRLTASLAPGFVLVFGALGRKRGAATLAAMRGPAADVVLTPADPNEPSLTGADVTAFGGDPVATCEDLTAALAHAVARADERGALLVIAGSLYLAGRARPWLRARSLAAGAGAAEPSAAGGDTDARGTGAMLTGRWDALDSSV